MATFLVAGALPLRETGHERIFFEDLNDAFPINSQVRCGQAAFRLGFAHMTLDDSEQLQPAHLQRSKKGRFMPRVPLKK